MSGQAMKSLKYFQSQFHPAIGWSEVENGNFGGNTHDISKEAYALGTEWLGMKKRGNKRGYEREKNQELKISVSIIL